MMVVMPASMQPKACQQITDINMSFGPGTGARRKNVFPSGKSIRSEEFGGLTRRSCPSQGMAMGIDKIPE